MRIKTNIKYLKCQSAILILMLFVVACDDHGIEPKPEPSASEISGFSGKVTFAGEWPDSVKRAFVVVFQNPLLHSRGFYNFKSKIFKQGNSAWSSNLQL